MSEEFKPKTEQEIKLDLIRKFNIALDDYSEEIPEQMIVASLSDPQSYRYKVSVRWFQYCMTIIGTAFGRGYISDDLNNELKNFREVFVARHSDSQKIKTTREEINQMNDFIRRAKAQLESK